MQKTREIVQVTEQLFGGGHAGELILDSVDFFGGIAHVGDLQVPDMAALQRLFDEHMAASDTLRARFTKQSGARLAFVVEGDLRIDGPLSVGETERGLSYCLAVHGSLHAHGLRIDAFSHVSVTGDLHAPLLLVEGSDGASIHCAGTATVGWFVHDQDLHELTFSAPPRRLRTYDTEDGFRDFPAAVQAVRDGRDLRTTEFEFRNFRVSRATRTLHVGSRAVPLAEAELALVVALVRALGRTRTRRGLVLEAPRWHDAVDWELSESDVDLHIEQIRAKLGDDARQLRFVRGAGYQLGRVSLFA